MTVGRPSTFDAWPAWRESTQSWELLPGGILGAVFAPERSRVVWPVTE